MLKLIRRCCEKDVPQHASKPILLQELLRHVFPDSDDVELQQLLRSYAALPTEDEKEAAAFSVVQ